MGTTAKTANTKTLPCGRPLPRKSAVSKAPAERSWREKLEHYISTKELNQSESRNRILELVLRLTEHFTAQELIRRVYEKYPQIGTATVYRNIPLLVDAGVLKETLTDDAGLKYYEVAASGHHDHIVCTDCNRIFEFHDEGIEKAQDRVSSRLNFLPVKHRHVIYASCGYRQFLPLVQPTGARENGSAHRRKRS